MSRPKRWMTLTVAILAVGCMAVGIAYAAGGIPGANGVIQGCYDGGGNLKVVASLPCPKGYTPLAWSQGAGSTSTFFANIAPDGTVVDSSSGVTAVETSTGIYEVTFPQAIAHCGVTGSIGSNADGGSFAAGGTVDVNLVPGTPDNVVGVTVWGFDDTFQVDSSFHLIAVC